MTNLRNQKVIGEKEKDEESDENFLHLRIINRFLVNAVYSKIDIHPLQSHLQM